MSVEKRARGRPPKPEGPDPAVLVKFPKQILAALDARAAKDGLTRSELIRRLVELGLRAKAGKRA
jgi:hypothetical protein